MEISEVDKEDEQLAWVAFLDVYGFASRLKSKKPLSELAETLKAMHATSEKEANFSATRTYFFSDSIILVQYVDDNARQAVSKLESLVRKLASEALKSSLVVRGAFGFGPMVTEENICLGLPLLQAYELEQQLYFPFVVIPEGACIEADVFSLNFKFRDVPTKSGILSAMVILPAPNESLLEYAVDQYQETRISGPQPVAKVWLDLIDYIQRIDHQRYNDERPEDERPKDDGSQD